MIDAVLYIFILYISMLGARFVAVTPEFGQVLSYAHYSVFAAESCPVVHERLLHGAVRGLDEYRWRSSMPSSVSRA